MHVFMLLMNMLILVINVFTPPIVASFVAVAVFSCGMFFSPISHFFAILMTDRVVFKDKKFFHFLHISCSIYYYSVFTQSLG